MDHTITLGDVLIASAVAVGVIVALAVIFWILAKIGEGFSR